MPARSPSFYSRDRSPYTPYSQRSPRHSPHARSPSPAGGRYSDSFHSDDDYQSPRGVRSRSPSGRTYTRKVKRGGAQGKKGAKKGSGPQSSHQTANVAAKRMLSARRLKINELKNEIELLSQELETIRKENKLLKRDNVIQTKQLNHLQDNESEIPQLVDRHNREITALKEQLRKYKQRHEHANKTLRAVEEELSRSQRKTTRLQEMVDSKDLEERDELSRRLTQAEADLQKKNTGIQQLERHVELLEKSHRREIISEMKKHAETKMELSNLMTEFERTRYLLKEREKELDVRNIYHNRVAKAQQRVSSVASLPALEAPPTKEARSPEISPREKARQFEIKRREDQSKKLANKKRLSEASKAAEVLPTVQEVPSLDQKFHKTPAENKPAVVPAEPVATQLAVSSNHHEQRNALSVTQQLEKEDSWEHIKRAQKKIYTQQVPDFQSSTSSSTVANQSTDDKLTTSKDRSFSTKALNNKEAAVTKQQEEDRRNQQQWQEEQQRQEERQHKEEMERRREHEKQEKEMQERRDRQEKEQKQRQAREEQETFERDQKQKQKEEEERRQNEAQRIRRQEELERQWKEDAEERARLARENEQKRLQNDAKAAEERRKKDLLLQKLKEMDGGSQTVPEKQRLTSNGDFFLTDGQSPSVVSASNSIRKEYNFKPTDENLHKGLPTHSDTKKASRIRNLLNDGHKDNTGMPVGGKKDSLFEDNDDDLDLGGYQPSQFGSQISTRSRTKAVPAAESESFIGKEESGNKSTTKTGLSSSTFSDDDFFSTNTKAKPVKVEKAGFPWEDQSPTKVGAQDKMLPKRPRADNTIHNKPTVRAINTLEDDLEEVVL